MQPGADPACTDYTEEVMQDEQSRDPATHTSNNFDELRDHLKENVDKIEEPQLRAMFETSAEVIGGLGKAFSDYEQKNEPASHFACSPKFDAD